MATVTEWVGVVFMQDEEYCDIADMGIDEMAEYLAQWDFGDETDAVHTTGRPQWGSSDRTYNVTVDGTDYVLAINYSLSYVSLNRRPLNSENG